MVFSSVTFLFFFLPVFLTAYFILPFKHTRNALILIASMIFYAWGEPIYVLLMVFSILVNYQIALGMAGEERPERKLVLICGLIVNLGTLIVFKYAGFIVQNFNQVSDQFIGFRFPDPDIGLPLGISFFTFQSMSYLIDVYRRQADVERNPFYVALYISMFPQLIAGPIVRFKTIAHQIHDRRFSYWRASIGARIFAIGLAQKVLIANEVAPLADAVFGLETGIGAIVAWLGLLSYSLQIYFDFAGYSNMAIGLGLILGFTFPRNFNFPYISQSVTEFWRRWHISLSTWFRDYLYIPLGGNRISPKRTYMNLLVVFLLCGLWHGAAWTFVIWGIHHGMFLVIERYGLTRLLQSTSQPIRNLYTLLAVVTGWVWFRADDLPAALRYFAELAGLHGFSQGYDQVDIQLNAIAIAGLISGVFFAMKPLLEVGFVALTPHRLMLRLTMSSGLAWPLALGKTIFVTFCLVASMLSVVSSTYNPFLYFRF